MLSEDACYEALRARDPRFDGLFFVGVRTTGIYCRPICPARTPGRARCSFHATPAQAEAAGFRACFRCRPELAPGAETPAPVDALDRLVERAARRIGEGALNEGSIEDLARELGVSARHLRRASEARLGVSPVELAQTRRLALAKQLLQDTSLSITEIAFAAGFRSLRRFNALFASKMGAPPSQLRRRPAARADRAITLRLDYRPPYDWARMVGFLRGRAIPGVEHVEAGRYQRVIALSGRVGVITVRPMGDRPALALELEPALVPGLLPLVARVRRMFDLDARPDVIAQTLGRDARMAPLVAAYPGLRLPGVIDPFEAAIRGIVGQQISVAGATTLAGRFAARFGAEIAGDGAVHIRFPTAAEIAAIDIDRIAAIGLPRKRAETIAAFARALADGELALEQGSHGAELDGFVRRLVAIPGIGPWTAQYLAMRALHLPDAFPASDLGVQKALGRAGARQAEARAEVWRPFRAYAVMHLWTAFAEGKDPAHVA